MGVRVGQRGMVEGRKERVFRIDWEAWEHRGLLLAQATGNVTPNFFLSLFFFLSFLAEPSSSFPHSPAMRCYSFHSVGVALLAAANLASANYCDKGFKLNDNFEFDLSPLKT